MALPLGAEGESVGALVVGLDPNRAPDESYRSFLELLAGAYRTN